MSSEKIMFYNQKGGVGKTTVSVNLGSALSALGRRVLLVDFDAQCNMTNAVSGDLKKSNIYQVLSGTISAEDAVQTTVFPNLFIIPGSINLAGLSVELVNEEDRDFYLRDSLSPISANFDYILLDCPPALGLETMNAFAWASSIIIPLQCEYFAMEGLNLLMRTLSGVKRSLNPKIEVLGILFTMYKSRSVLDKQVVDDITAFFKDQVFKTIIPRNIRLAEAPSFGMPINYFDNSSKGARAFEDLAKEVIEREHR